MSFSSNSTRPRAYSKATREELKELNTYLAQRNADELRSVIHLAATQSSETAHILLKLLNATTNSPFQPVQPHIWTDDTPSQTQQQQHGLEHISSLDGLLTPADSEDSEMSGTENMPPPPQQSMSAPQPTHCGSLSLLKLTSSESRLQGNTKGPLSPAQERRLKRKSLAEWDENTVSAAYPSSSFSRSTMTPTPTSFQLQHSPSTKRRRAAQIPHGLKDQQQQQQQLRQVSTCLNCGKEYSYSPSQHAGSVHGCMYHPGVLEAVETEHEYKDSDIYDNTRAIVLKAGRWDCCRGLHSSPGCLVTQHRDVKVDGYRISQYALSSLGMLNCWGSTDGFSTGVGARSMFAELTAGRFLS